MRSISSKIILLIYAVLIALGAGASVVIYQYFFVGQINLIIIIKDIIISFITSLLFIVFVNTLVFKKIDKILTTVKVFRSQSNGPMAHSKNNTDEIELLQSEIMALADERKNEIERLKKLEMYRKEFLGNVSHELKTPIFNIQGYVLTLLDGGLEDKTINRNYLERAEKSVDRIIHIIEDLEAISQLETGELILEPERFEIITLVKEVVDAEEMRATTKGIMLNVPGNKPVFVYADKFRIRQVLVNLIVNSIKYGREYGETKIALHEMDNMILIEVVDNGLGIAPEHLPRLFERFYRVDKSRSHDQGGTGLGLAIVKHIIEAHNQTIRVTSKEGIGTTFSFTLTKV